MWLGVVDGQGPVRALMSVHNPDLHGGAWTVRRASSAVDEEVPATSQLTVTYLRPGKPGTLVVRAEVSKRGQSLMMCEADVEQDGKSLAHALATFALVGG